MVVNWRKTISGLFLRVSLALNFTNVLSFLFPPPPTAILPAHTFFPSSFRTRIKSTSTSFFSSLSSRFAFTSPFTLFYFRFSREWKFHFLRGYNFFKSLFWKKSFCFPFLSLSPPASSFSLSRLLPPFWSSHSGLLFHESFFFFLPGISLAIFVDLIFRIFFHSTFFFPGFILRRRSTPREPLWLLFLLGGGATESALTPLLSFYLFSLTFIKTFWFCFYYVGLFYNLLSFSFLFRKWGEKIFFT